jgi:adenylate cyclase
MEGKEGGRGLRRSLQGILVGAAAAAVAVALWLPGILDVFEAKTWDLRARLLARPGSATSQVVTILLDQYSLDWASQQGVNWPWPRSLYAMIADFCRAGGAKALVVDVLYTEETNEDVGQDEELARGFADNGKVVAALNLATKKGQGSAQAWPADVPRPGITVAAGDPRRLTGLTFPYAQFPIAAVSKSARFLANTNLPADPSDGVYRREPLFSLFDGIVLPSEALGAWAVAQSGPVELTLGRGIVSARAGTAVVTAPVDEDGQAILRYRGPTLKHAHYTAASVLNSAQQMLEGSKPELSPEVFRNKYVFFGFTAPGLFDLKPTPMAGSYPGVEVNATMLDNLISGDFMRPVPLVATIVLLLLLCLGPGIAVSRVSGVGATALVYAIALPIAPALAISAYAIGYWLPVVALELGAAFSLVGASLASYATEGRQRRYLKGAFRQYLSPVVIDELIAHPERLKLGGEKRELTIFFSDIQGFTTISEALGAEALTHLLNEYLSAMGDIIQEEGGTIDKYIGDAIVAFWNAPVDQENHALRGTRAALRCQSRLAEIRPSLKERYGKDVYARIGLNTGPVTVGNMGSSTRFNYTMLGDAANLASRLEGINKYFHTYFMASASVIERLGGAYPARELSRVAVVGRREPVTVYEPMLPEQHAQRRPTLEVFHRGLQEFYAGRFAEARRVFAEIAGQDPPAGVYELKCAELAEHPPAGAWNGVWVMTEK